MEASDRKARVSLVGHAMILQTTQFCCWFSRTSAPLKHKKRKAYSLHNLLLGGGCQLDVCTQETWTSTVTSQWGGNIEVKKHWKSTVACLTNKKILVIKKSKELSDPKPLNISLFPADCHHSLTLIGSPVETES